MDRLMRYMAERAVTVDKALDKYLPRLDEEPKSLHEAMRYSVFAGGKRLRPLLCIMAGEIFGAKEAELLPSACALEMVHTYSLIHDDLPAMDNDDYRRGKLSCHKAFGDALAILAGDALHTLAFETIARHARRGLVTELTRLFAAAIGWSGMVGGQVLDLEAEGSARDPARPGKSNGTSRLAEDRERTLGDRVQEIHRLKTGSLITVAVEMGAVTGRADRAQRASLVEYGRKIGLAFQIKDDILDVEAPAEKLGKTAGKDAAAGKLTYPAAIGMERAKTLLRESVMDAKNSLKDFGEKALMLRLLADFIAEREH
ncbi:MAG: polyprenyl synthetase family protein [Planctomycetota bacterium]